MIAWTETSASPAYNPLTPLPSRRGQSLPHAVAGFGDSITEGAAAAPNYLDSGSSFAPWLRGAYGFPFGGPCGDTRKCVPVPSAGSPTPYGLPPSFGDEVGGFKTCSEGATIMADTTTLHPQFAPVRTRATHAKFKPTSIELHVDAENALAMASYYLRQPTSNVIGARRKAVQALAALNQLRVAGYADADADADAANDSGRD